LGLNADDSSPEAITRNHLVVAHSKDGTLTKGFLQWHVPFGDTVPLPQLPDVLHIQHQTGGASSSVQLCDAKAVFFVRTHEGNHEYDEVRFFSGGTASDLWIQVRLIDGEVLEGRTENGICLLSEPGFWLWPADGVTNNLMVYVPKSSAVDFQVMGLVTARQQRQATGAPVAAGPRVNEPYSERRLRARSEEVGIRAGTPVS
jgi:hypothetical protein